MHLRLIGAVLVLLGLVAGGTGVASATLWRPADEAQAEALAPGATTLLVTDPGVLELVADTVTARATGPQGARIVMVVGREADVRSWIGLDPHARVTGLADAATLATEPGQPLAPPVAPAPTEEPEDGVSPSDDASPNDGASPGDDADEAAAGATSPTDGTVPDPSGSDMWILESSGETTAELSWQARPGRWALLVASTGPDAGPPTLDLTWPREVVTPWFRPGLWLGGGLVVLGAALFVLGLLRARGRDEEWTDVAEDEALEVPTGPLTRRQLRELEAARSAGRSRGPSRRRGPAPVGSDDGVATPEVTASPVADRFVPEIAPSSDSAAEDAASSTAPSTAPAAGATPFTPIFAPRPVDAAEPEAPTPSAAPAGAETRWSPTGAVVPSPVPSPAPSPVPSTPEVQSSAPEADLSEAAPGGPAPEDAVRDAVAHVDVAPDDAAHDDAAPYVPKFAPVAEAESGRDTPAFRSRRVRGARPQPAPHVPPVTVPEVQAGTPADPAETAASRSRTGKFFTRRSRAAAPVDAADVLAHPGPSTPLTDPAPTPFPAVGGPDAGAQPSGPAATGPAAAGPASGDAWRARWGFVEVPPPLPTETDAGPAADDQEGGQP